ncbi:hypothetical protein K3495_g4814 [Podosphaera aphanis]|nr:hypothetical protein K3495_g4814 [Podosphaera aphanis]
MTAIVKVSLEALFEEIKRESGLQAVSTIETKTRAETPHFMEATWIVRFDLGETLPRAIQLFGFRCLTKHLKDKASIVQCNRCHMWHNARACNRPPRCKLCGSTGHSSHDHPEEVFPKCIHCHGPLAADFAGCLLRKSKDQSFSKSQMIVIRQSSSAARMMFEVSLKAKAATTKTASAVAALTTTSPDPTEACPEAPATSVSQSDQIEVDVPRPSTPISSAPQGSAVTPTNTAPFAAESTRPRQSRTRVFLEGAPSGSVRNLTTVFA